MSSWRIAEQLDISNAFVLYWTRAFSLIMLDVPIKERNLVAVDKTELKVNGKTVYVWAAVDYETRELLAIKATRGRSAFDAMLFLKEVLKKCTNKPTFVVDRGPWYRWAFEVLELDYYHETFGKRNRIERFFATLKRRTKLFYNNINARKLHINALNLMLRLFFTFYNWFRFHKGINEIPALRGEIKM